MQKKTIRPYLHDVFSFYSHHGVASSETVPGNRAGRRNDDQHDRPADHRRPRAHGDAGASPRRRAPPPSRPADHVVRTARGPPCRWLCEADRRRKRSEEHTSELQSLMRISYAVFCLKKKKKNI